jgi:hypothetical protein
VRLGRYEEAESTYRQVLDGRRRVLGDQHPDTLVTRHTLAWAIAQQGRHAEAEQQFRAVMRDQRQVETADHPHVLGSGRALGWSIAQQGRHAEAEQQFRQVLMAQQGSAAPTTRPPCSPSTGWPARWPRRAATARPSSCTGETWTRGSGSSAPAIQTPSSLARSWTRWCRRADRSGVRP